MEKRDYTEEVLLELSGVLRKIDKEQAEKCAALILSAKRVFVAGMGRSGLAARAFAMRLMHMGLSVSVVGDVTTPGFASGDLLVVCSGSGETPGLLAMAQKAASIGGRIALVTIGSGSSIGKVSDEELHIPAPSPKRADSRGGSVQPMASLFEQALLIALDILVLRIMEIKGISSEEMFKTHANLE